MPIECIEQAVKWVPGGQPRVLPCPDHLLDLDRRALIEEGGYGIQSGADFERSQPVRKSVRNLVAHHFTSSLK